VAGRPRPIRSRMKILLTEGVSAAALACLFVSVSACAVVTPDVATPESVAPAAQVESPAISVVPEPVAEPQVEAVAPSETMPVEKEGTVAPPPKVLYKREDVLWIQQRLQELGYYGGNIDGAVGSATRDAVKAYQRDQDIREDGRPTTQLREFMWRNGG